MTLDSAIIRRNWCFSYSSLFRLWPFSLLRPLSQIRFCFCVLAIWIVTLVVKSVLSEPDYLHMACLKRLCVIVFSYTQRLCVVCSLVSESVCLCMYTNLQEQCLPTLRDIDFHCFWVRRSVNVYRQQTRRQHLQQQQEHTQQQQTQRQQPRHHGNNSNRGVCTWKGCGFYGAAMAVAAVRCRTSVLSEPAYLCMTCLRKFFVWRFMLLRCLQTRFLVLRCLQKAPSMLASASKRPCEHRCTCSIVSCALFGHVVVPLVAYCQKVSDPDRNSKEHWPPLE